MLGVLPAHLPLVLDAGSVLLSVPPLICAGFVYCHCTGMWAVLDNTHGKDCGPFRSRAVVQPLPWPLLLLNRSFLADGSISDISYYEFDDSFLL